MCIAGSAATPQSGKNTIFGDALLSIPKRADYSQGDTMAYQIKKDSGFSIVHLTGDIDLSCSPEARKSILDSLSAAQPTLVDLSAVTYIDSSGVASLVEGYQTAKKKNLEFGLLGVSEAALSVLELARLDRVFPIHASLKDRLAKND